VSDDAGRAVAFSPGLGENQIKGEDADLKNCRGLRWLAAAALVGASLGFSADGQGADPYAAARRRMVVDQLEGRDITDRRVLEAMGAVPRERFVDPDLRSLAYEDQPLPIGEGQTISQPYIVALMTQCLELKGTEKVLEVGTGSGYQAAVLSGLARRIFTIEIDARLATLAARLLSELGYASVTVRYGDGFNGWPDEAPFDDVIVTCAVDRVPGPLFDQLKEGGRLVLPLGDSRRSQVLTVVRKIKDRPVSRGILDVRFVPMTGEALKNRG